MGTETLGPLGQSYALVANDSEHTRDQLPASVTIIMAPLTHMSVPLLVLVPVPVPTLGPLSDSRPA